MSALGSSVINKSTKKVAPKRAPARRFQNADSTQELARPAAELSPEPQTIHTDSTQPRITALSIVPTSSSREASNRLIPSPTLTEQQTRNVSLPVSRDTPSLRKSSRQSNLSRRRTKNPQQTSHERNATIPAPQAASSTTIPDETRRPRKPRGKNVTQPGRKNDKDQNGNDGSVQQEDGQDSNFSVTDTPRKSANARRKKRIEDVAAAVVESAIQGSSRSAKNRGRRTKRGLTPEEAQHVRIDVAETKMADLCRDDGTGQRSTADKTIRENERAAAQKKTRQEAHSIIGMDDESAAAQALDARESKIDRLDREWRQREEAMANAVPQQRIVNGEIVLDTSSLRIDRHAIAAVERDAEQLESVEEDEYTRKVNSGLGLKRDKSGGWNEMLVDRFYDGLRMFGTDFGMISKLFPGKSRHSIKLKFCKEEKGDYPRIRAALLGEVLPVELEEFQKMTGEEYDDPAVLERDIEEDKRQLEEEQEKEKEAIEAARRERAEQAEAERLASQGEESSGKESRGRKRKKGETGRKRKEKDEKRQKRSARAKEKNPLVVEGTAQIHSQEGSNEAAENG